MKRAPSVELKAKWFGGTLEPMISFGVAASDGDWGGDFPSDGSRWTSDSTTICTIDVAEEFAKELAKAIAGAKAEAAAANAAAEKTIEERAKACGELAMDPNGDFQVTKATKEQVQS